jgi:hypothetical protein
MSEKTPASEDVEFLHDLAKRIFRIPVMHGVDGYDFDRLRSLAQRIEQTTQKHPNGRPKFSLDGTLLDDKGNRSIFDDVDE